MSNTEKQNFRTAKESAKLHPELFNVMSPKSFSLFQLCNMLGLSQGGSVFCRLGITIALMHSDVVEKVKNASHAFDQKTKLAMLAPNYEQEKLESD